RGGIEVGGGARRLEHLAALGDVDIALDPFPQNGGISSWEALWQGVPVVAKLGITAPGRLSGAVLSAVRLTHWIATTEDDYSRLAIAKAADLAAVARRSRRCAGGCARWSKHRRPAIRCAIRARSRTPIARSGGAGARSADSSTQRQWRVVVPLGRPLGSGYFLVWRRLMISQMMRG